MTNLYLGIDPGADGAYCLLDGQGNLVKRGRLREKNLGLGDDFFSFLLTITGKNARVGLERVGAMPGQGVSSMFSFGVSYGRVQGFLEAAGLPFELVSPQTWQRILPDVEGGGPKDRVREFCRGKWGLEGFILERCCVPHQGAMDAAALADYLRRVDLGEVEAPKVRPKKVKRQPIKLAG